MRSKRTPCVQFDHRSTSEEVGACLKAIRVNLGLSQRAVADMLGVSFQQIQKYERGSNDISVVRLTQFCQALKVDASVILASVSAAL